MEHFSISKKELEENDDAEQVYICEECREEHPIEITHSKVVFCTSHDSKCQCKGTSIGFYRCKDQSYLYSINGKQVV